MSDFYALPRSRQSFSRWYYVELRDKTGGVPYSVRVPQEGLADALALAIKFTLGMADTLRMSDAALSLTVKAAS